MIEQESGKKSRGRKEGEGRRTRVREDARKQKKEMEEKGFGSGKRKQLEETERVSSPQREKNSEKKRLCVTVTKHSRYDRPTNQPTHSHKPV